MSFWDMSSANLELANVRREPALRFSKALQERGGELPKPTKKRRQAVEATYYPMVTQQYNLLKKIADWKKGLASNN